MLKLQRHFILEIERNFNKIYHLLLSFSALRIRLNNMTSRKCFTLRHFYLLRHFPRYRLARWKWILLSTFCVWISVWQRVPLPCNRIWTNLRYVFHSVWFVSMMYYLLPCRETLPHEVCKSPPDVDEASTIVLFSCLIIATQRRGCFIFAVWPQITFSKNIKLRGL